MIRNCITLLLLLFATTLAMAQDVDEEVADSILLKEAMDNLDRAFLQRDTVALQAILHPQISYGHSNGWVENKKTLVADVVKGFLVYKKLNSENVSVAFLNRNWAMVRTSTKVTGSLGGKDLDATLHILEMWTRSRKGWQLVARQSTKLN
jgi:hypothetical protein